MSERYCLDCRVWYDGKLSCCPECATPKPAWNKSLYTAKVNDGLYKQIEHAKTHH